MPWEKYDGTPSTYDPGQVVILFDNRMFSGEKDKLSRIQSGWLAAKYKLGWPSLWNQELEPGKIRLIWYTHAGVEGKRDYHLFRAYAVLEMFESLSSDGFRPMILGWSAENPFPMIGGNEPPPEPKKAQPKLAKTWSPTVSGHGKGEVHERIMNILNKEEEREAEERRKLVGKGDLAV
ncbi:hypothetical protein K431DRAFT_290479 [Polychaeton citri CBS 116435]|uniref:Uncharacterized protein n=1 Tax=Polychaeton citri CBS 116435 TaxID=1314669 RepID=A0A9P4QGF8_9PEZI|nr:hypothetical protein K431DRAFT_290479 [Polychaeton citri CBS 116435]